MQIVKGNKNFVLTIGWIGGFGGGHKKSLIQYFFPGLKNLPFKIKLILLGVVEKSEFDFLTDYFLAFENVVLEMPQNIAWGNENEIQNRIVEFDIGIATLLNDELHRSKSAFKTKQYLNNGVPVLSSNIPENNLFVEHGKNGFFCSTPIDFREAIIKMNELSTEDYQRFSDLARKSCSQFSLTKYCESLIDEYI